MNRSAGGPHATADCRIQESPLCSAAGSSLSQSASGDAQALHLAVHEWEWYWRNPVLSVSMERKSNGRDRQLTVEEEGRVLAACGPWLGDISAVCLGNWHANGRDSVALFAHGGSDTSNGDGVPIEIRRHRTIPLNQTVLNLITGRGTIRSLSTDLVFPSKTHASLKNTFMMSCRSVCCFHWSCNPKPKASLGFKVDFPLFIGGRPNHSGVATIEIVDVTSDI